jgi:hypothetical protein
MASICGWIELTMPWRMEFCWVAMSIVTLPRVAGVADESATETEPQASEPVGFPGVS